MQSDLIFTTKGRYSSAWIIILGIIGIIAEFILLILNLVMSIFVPGFLIADLFILLAMFISIVAIIWVIIKADKMQKSFIELHENYIVGVSTGMITFRLHYEQISHVNSQNGTINVFFQGGKYEVQAKGVEEEVITLIQKQQLQTK